MLRQILADQKTILVPGAYDALSAKILKQAGFKVLYMSGYTDTAIVRHGLLDPSVSFIQKPFSPEVLARKIKEVLEY